MVNQKGPPMPARTFCANRECPSRGICGRTPGLEALPSRDFQDFVLPTPKGERCELFLPLKTPRSPSAFLHPRRRVEGAAHA